MLKKYTQTTAHTHNSSFVVLVFVLPFTLLLWWPLVVTAFFVAFLDFPDFASQELFILASITAHCKAFCFCLLMSACVCLFFCLAHWRIFSKTLYVCTYINSTSTMTSFVLVSNFVSRSLRSRHFRLLFDIIHFIHFERVAFRCFLSHYSASKLTNFLNKIHHVVWPFCENQNIHTCFSLSLVFLFKRC